jgi:hypothetical protein
MASKMGTWPAQSEILKTHQKRRFSLVFSIGGASFQAMFPNVVSLLGNSV